MILETNRENFFGQQFFGLLAFFVAFAVFCESLVLVSQQWYLRKVKSMPLA